MANPQTPNTAATTTPTATGATNRLVSIAVSYQHNLTGWGLATAPRHDSALLRHKISARTSANSVQQIWPRNADLAPSGSGGPGLARLGALTVGALAARRFPRYAAGLGTRSTMRSVIG